jgi:hypothetical protein
MRPLAHDPVPPVRTPQISMAPRIEVSTFGRRGPAAQGKNCLHGNQSSEAPRGTVDVRVAPATSG